MSSIDQIRELLHLIAGFLLWPVLLGLLGLGAAMVFSLGSFLGEAWARARGHCVARQRVMQELDQVSASLISDAGLDLALERILQDDERQRWRGLSRLRLAVRVGPSLGLMGTLIPMAAALQGLSEGNLPKLASNMVTAFAATVVGLSISVTAYLISAAREAWVRADTVALVFHAEHCLRRAKEASGPQKERSA